MATVNLLKKITTAGGNPAVAETSMFASAVIVGDGLPQSTAHGLGSAPSLVLVMLVGSPVAGYSQAVVVEGAHDATNCVVTCTPDWSYRILAFK